METCAICHMSESIVQTDVALKGELLGRSNVNSNYWDYKSSCGRTASNDYYQYPAMMVPAMLSDLMSIVVETCPNVTSVYNPFIGSGTVQTEAMTLGLDCFGVDVNPLAILLSRCKAGPFLPDQLESKAEDLLSVIEDDTSSRREAKFVGLTKWFQPKVIIELSKIRRAIRTERDLWARRFFWVVLAETVRRTSNSRTSTFKLHIRTASDIAVRRLSSVEVFESVLDRNIQLCRTQTEKLREGGLLSRGRYIGQVHAKLGSVLDLSSPGTFDFLVTSPPYGDNVSTVPYGQSSYLPLQWIDLSDIDRQASNKFLRSTHEIDGRSLGGRTRDALDVLDGLRDASPHLASLLDCLKHKPIDRTIRVAAFCRDLHKSIGSIISSLRKDAYMIWVVGNRRVGGEEVNLAHILSDYLRAAGAREVTTLGREILSKRMAVKNSVSCTMKKESILVFRNARQGAQR